MKTKLMLIAEIEHDEPGEGQTAVDMAERKLDAFREAVLPADNYGVVLYRPSGLRIVLLGNLHDGFRAEGPFEDFDTALNSMDNAGVRCEDLCVMSLRPDTYLDLLR